MIFPLAQRHGSASEAIVVADKVVAIIPEGRKGCIIRTVGEPLFVAATATEVAAALGFKMKDLTLTSHSPPASAKVSLLRRLYSRTSSRV